MRSHSHQMESQTPYQPQEYYRMTPTNTPERYHHSAAQEGSGGVSNDLSNTGKRMLWTINLRPGQKLVDEEQGLPIGSINSHAHAEEYNKTKALKKAYDVKIIEIVQTRSIPEDEENETVILTHRDLKGNEKSNEVACETRWIHTRNNPMSFDDFQTVATEAPGLAKDEIALLLRLLRRVRHNYEKSFVHGRYLLPIACRYVGNKSNRRPVEKAKATFFSFPYFCLRPLSTLKHLDRHTPVHPPRTLLQSHYRSVSTGDRDKKQVVRKLGHWNGGEALYVSQLWCTLVDRNTIVTNTDLDLSDLLGKNIRVEPYSATIPVEGGLSTVQYTDFEGQLYFFPIAQCKTWFELLQTIGPSFIESLDLHELIAEDGQPVTDENWSTRVEQEKSSRIRLTLARKEILGSSESEDTEPDDGPLETHSSEVALPMTSASNMLEETLEVPRPDSPKDHIKDSTSHTPHSREFIGRRRESEITGLAGGQDYPIVLNGQSSRELSTSNLVQSSHSDPPNGLNSHENVTNSPFTVFPLRSTTQPLPTSARPNVTFTTRPYSFEPSILGETSSPLRSDDEANNGRRDTTAPNIPQFTRLKERRLTEYPVVRPDEDFSYPRKANGRYHFSSRPSHNSTRSFVYNEDDVVLNGTISPQYRDRAPLRRSRRRGQRYKRSGHGSAEPDDIYYNPPTTEKAADTPSISVSAASVQPKSQNTFAEHTGTQKEEGENLVAKPQKSTLRKGRRTSSVKRPVSPGSGNPISLPIFLWPIGQSSTVNASERARKESSGNSIEVKDNLSGFRSLEVNDETLARIVDDADKQLKSSKKTYERKAYATVETKSLQEVEDTMSRILTNEYSESGENRIPPAVQRIGRLMTNIHSSKRFAANRHEKGTLELKKGILDSTKRLLHAFVPRNYRSSIIDKYWGAVCLVLQDNGRLSNTDYNNVSSDDNSSNGVFPYLQETMSEFLDIVKYIQNGVSPGSVEVERFRYQIPKALFEAFTRLVMIFVLYSSVSSAVDEESAAELARVADSCVDQCRDLLIKGKNQLILMVHTDDDGERVSYEALEPEVILALVLENLMETSFQAGEYEMDMAELYSEYMSQLEIQVQAKPSVRKFRDIKYLSEELDIIQKTLVSQRQVLLDYRKLVDGGDSFPLGYSYSFSLRRKIFNRSIQSMDQKIEEIKELSDRASYTQFLAAQTISVQTESKDRAILVFTIVTVIFLPLTFVTGYLGMNVQDIRNLALDQGLFWSIALPITFVIFVVVLLLMAPSLRQRLFAVFPSRRDKDD